MSDQVGNENVGFLMTRLISRSGVGRRQRRRFMGVIFLFFLWILHVISLSCLMELPLANDCYVIVALSGPSIELVLFHVLQRCCFMRPSARIGVNMSPSFTAISI